MQPHHHASLCLVRLSPDQTNPARIDLSSAATTTIGRAGDIVVDSKVDPGSISRLHAVVEARASGLFVTNVSTNGVLVDNKRVPRNAPTMVAVGHTVTFGLDTHELHYKLVSGPRRRPLATTPPPGCCPEGAEVDRVSPVVARGLPEASPRPTRFSAASRSPVRATVGASAAAPLRSSTPVHGARDETPRRRHPPPPSPARNTPQRQRLEVCHMDPTGDAAAPPVPPPPPPSLLQPRRPVRIQSDMHFIDGSDGVVPIPLAEWRDVSVALSQRLPADRTVVEALVTERGAPHVMATHDVSITPLVMCAHSTIALLRSVWDGSAFRHTPTTFAQLRELMLHLCGGVKSLHVATPACVSLPAPCFVFGDIHGSFADALFAFNLVNPAGDTALATASALFLGDYVDRGHHSVEVVALLFAWKCVAPERVHLLRGNHEDPWVNGDGDTYGTTSFLARCAPFAASEIARTRLWQCVNDAFATLPICATVADAIFATHGGVPDLRNLLGPSNEPHLALDAPRNVVDFLNRVIGSHRFDTVMPDASDDAERSVSRSITRQLIWNDPAASTTRELHETLWFAPESQQQSVDQGKEELFRRNLGRGDVDGTVLEFTSAAVSQFFEAFNLSLLMRAHQHKDKGLQLEFEATVLTIFTSSNYCRGNSAGACLVRSEGSAQLISWVSNPSVSGTGCAAPPARRTQALVAAPFAALDSLGAQVLLPAASECGSLPTAHNPVVGAQGAAAPMQTAQDDDDGVATCG